MSAAEGRRVQADGPGLLPAPLGLGCNANLVQVVSSIRMNSLVVSKVVERCGLKAFATDGPLPRPATSRYTGCSYFWYGDEHGGMSRPADEPAPAVPGHRRASAVAEPGSAGACGVVREGRGEHRGN